MEFLAKLGNLVFSMKTAPFDQIKRESKFRWARHELIGSKAVHHYVGPGEDKITINGIIYPEFFGKISTLAELRKMAAEGKSHGFTYASEQKGQYLGKWII